MAKERKLRNKIALFILIGLIPGLFLYVFSKGRQEFKPLPYLGPQVNGEHYEIKNFEMTLMNGKKAHFNDFKGKYIISFIIGKTCPNDCEIQNEGLQHKLIKEFKGNDHYKDVVILVEYRDYDSEVLPDYELMDPYYTETVNIPKLHYFQCEKNEFFNYSAKEDKPNMLNERRSGYRNGRPYYQLITLVDKEGKPRMLQLSNGSYGFRRILDGLKVLKKEEDYAKQS